MYVPMYIKAFYRRQLISLESDPTPHNFNSSSHLTSPPPPIVKCNAFLFSIIKCNAFLLPHSKKINNDFL